MAVMPSTGPAARIARTVPFKAGKDAELDLGEAKARPLLAVGNSVVAGERQFQPAAQAVAMYRRHNGNRELLDPVEQRQRLGDGILDLVLSVVAIELIDVRAGDEARILGADENETLDLARLGTLDDGDNLLQFFHRAAPQRVHALALAVRDRPGDTLEVDR